MAEWGFNGGSGEMGMGYQPNLNDQLSFDPSEMFDNTPNCVSDLNPTMGIQFNNPEYGQHQPSGMSSGALHNQPILPEKKLKKKEADKKYRDKKKKKEEEKKNELDRLRAENESLKREMVLLNEKLQVQENENRSWKNDLEKLKCEQNAVVQRLTELLKNMVVDLDGDDSGDESDGLKKNRKRAARSAPSGRGSGKFPKFANELMETGQVTLPVKRECYDAGAERYGSTSNPTAMVIDPYSIEECIRILESMEDISESVAMKAITKFESSDTARRTFLAIKKEDWRRKWVNKLEDA